MKGTKQKFEFPKIQLFKKLGLGTILFLVFLVMKLGGFGEVANWSWWWVTSPLWLPIVLVLAFFVGIGIVLFIAGLIAALIGKDRY